MAVRVRQSLQVNFFYYERYIIPLCPNHHWEFDNGVMNEDNLLKIEKYLKNKKNSGMEE